MRASDTAEVMLGSMQLGLAYGVSNCTGKPERAAAIALVYRARAAGIVCFDTARAHGDAEERSGIALAGDVGARVITKLSRLAEVPPTADEAMVRAVVDVTIVRSCAAVGRSRLEVLMLHRAQRLQAFGGAVWQRLLEFARAGPIGTLGFSVQSPAEAHQANDCPEVRHIQLPFNFLGHRWDEAGVMTSLRTARDNHARARRVPPGSPGWRRSRAVATDGSAEGGNGTRLARRDRA